MRRALALTLSAGLALAVAAAPEPKPAALPAKDAADGWLLLFDGESPFGWHSPNATKWTVADGMLAPQAGQKDDPLLVNTTAFRDYVLELDYKKSRDGKAQVRVGCRRDGSPDPKGDAPLELGHVGEGWAHLRAEVTGGRLARVTEKTGGVGFGGQAERAFPRTPGQDAPAGHVGLSGTGVVFKNVRLKPTTNKVLFNGKDLDGWKVHPDRKSKFTVTPEGWLRIQDGPGDLQTAEAFDDFVLQLECKTNGKHLNSGVFFRCRPGEYQQGYEAQIHNGFQAEATKEYVVEEFDPKTNEPKEKTKVKSAALDYGTGAIYRRVPARRAAANDNEWFTMTVVANGRHMATWVNGVQTVDWTDHRPAKDNARQGYREAAGPISLQGHDPTTDLLFRNFRLGTLGAAKK